MVEGVVTTHDLKTWPRFFAAVWDGTKKAELRRADRPFAVGDTLKLHEWDPEMYQWAKDDGCDHEEATEFAYTGRLVWAKVTHILRNEAWLLDDCVMLSIEVERLSMRTPPGPERN
jgi:hypothetical protein